MTELVVDASAAVFVALYPGSFHQLRQRRLVAPTLLWSEAASALHEQVWRNEIDDETGLRALRVVLEAPIAAVHPPALQPLAWEVSRRLGWARTYDAEYVALAEQRKCPLLTTDMRLQRRVGGLVEVIGPADL